MTAGAEHILWGQDCNLFTMSNNEVATAGFATAAANGFIRPSDLRPPTGRRGP